jgi:hypothetical protein
MDNMTETRFVRHTFTEKEIVELAQKMARAESTIGEKADELKSVSTTIKAEIAEQEAILHKCAEKLRSGYEVTPKECNVSYNGNKIKYVEHQTGEVIEEREMTDEEQLKLTEHRIDAEKIIRQARAEEDEKESR